MSAGIFSTPRPLPSRIGPTIAGGDDHRARRSRSSPIAGWPLKGWALAAVLWVASADLRSWYWRAFRTAPITSPPRECGNRNDISRGLLVGIVLVIVTVSNETVGLAAAILYAIAFTVELGVGLATYFGEEAKA